MIYLQLHERLGPYSCNLSETNLYHLYLIPSLDDMDIFRLLFLFNNTATAMEKFLSIGVNNQYAGQHVLNLLLILTAFSDIYFKYQELEIPFWRNYQHVLLCKRRVVRGIYLNKIFIEEVLQ